VTYLAKIAIKRAQGLPWVIAPTRICPHKALLRCTLEKNTRRARVGDAEGATRYVENRLQTFEPDRRRISGPYRAKRLSGLTQGKPWAGYALLPLRGGPVGLYDWR